MSDQPTRTQFAMKALDLAEMFKMFFGEQHVTGGGNTYSPDLSAPDGPSTGGGKQAVQHVKLVPVGGGATIVAGSCNQLEQSAELRTYNHLAQLHAQRFKGAKLPLDERQYTELVGKMQNFFTERNIRVSLSDAPKAAAPAQQAGARPAQGGSQLGIILTVVIVTALVVGAAMFFLLRSRGEG